MLGIVAAAVADVVVGYVEGEAMSAVVDVAKDYVNGKRLSNFILEQTKVAARDIEICDDTKEVLDTDNKEFNKMRKGFVTSILKDWRCEDASWFVTVPPCAKRMFSVICEDFSKLIKAIKAKLWGNQEFCSLMGSERYQKVLQVEFLRLDSEVKEIRQNFESLKKDFEKESEDRKKENEELRKEIGKLESTVVLLEEKVNELLMIQRGITWESCRQSQ